MVSSCTKDETIQEINDVPGDVARLSLGPVIQAMDLNRQEITPDETPECSDLPAAYAQIRLEYGDDNEEVITVVKILKDDDGKLFTAYSDDLEIPIPSGETSVSVTLTDFVVWSDLPANGGVVIWVAPKDESDFAQFVSDPLSNNWSLRAGSKNYQEVEVICFDDREVNLYGYQFFDIIPVPLSELCVFANYCLTPDGRHRVANYTFDLYTYSGEVIEENPDPSGSMYTLINEGDDTPVTGLDGESYYAEPLCLPIPKGDDENGDVPYLYWEMSLEDWEGYYGAAPNLELSGYLTWNQVKMYLDKDGDDATVDYIHIFFNCEDGDGPDPCDLDDPDADCDDDGIDNGDENEGCKNNPDPDCGEETCTNPTTWYRDQDGDGFGDPNTTQEECEQPEGYVDNNSDCDDTNDNIGEAITWYRDQDGDGLGDPSITEVACEQPTGFVDNANDPCPEDETNTCNVACDDTNPNADCDDDGTLNKCDTDNPNYPTFDCDGDNVPNGQDDCPTEAPELVDYNMDGCEDIPDTCDFTTDNDCSLIVWDQTTASGGDPFYGIDLNGENIGSVSISLDGNNDVVIELNLDIDYLLDDIYIVLDDGTPLCRSNVGQGLNEFTIPGTFSEQQSVLIYANVCPATTN
ncbi:hypothetical protein GCM10023115_48070 [Pontixanthobacter gangjinensis]